MYCPNCGKQLPDGAKFCSNCGKDLTGTDQNQNIPTETSEETALTQTETAGKGTLGFPKKNWLKKWSSTCNDKWNTTSKKTKKIFIISISTVLALAIIAAIVVPIAQAKNDEKHIMDPVNNLVEFYNNRSTDMEDYYHYFYFPYFSDSEFDKAWPQLTLFSDTDSTKENVESAYEDSDSSWGKDWKISVKLVKATKMKSSDYHSLVTRMSPYTIDGLNNVENMLEDPSALSESVQNYNAKKGTHLREKSYRNYLKLLKKGESRVVDPQIQNGYLIKATFLQKGSKDSYQFDFSFYSIKVEGVWIGVDAENYSYSRLITPYYKDENEEIDENDSQEADEEEYEEDPDEDSDSRVEELKKKHPEDAKYYNDDSIDWSADTLNGKIVKFQRNEETGGVYIEKIDDSTGNRFSEFLPPKTLRDPTYKDGQWNYNLSNLDGIV